MKDVNEVKAWAAPPRFSSMKQSDGSVGFTRCDLVLVIYELQKLDPAEGRRLKES